MIFTDFNDFVFNYVKLSNVHNVRQILVGGGAVNFYGYKRHSADVDFWLDCTKENLNNLTIVLKELGYKFDSFPDSVFEAKQNVSIKATPHFDLELITQFNPNKTFKEAYADAEIAEYIWQEEKESYRVLHYDDLITSKVKASRPKDLLDISELKRIRE